MIMKHNQHKKHINLMALFPVFFLRVIMWVRCVCLKEMKENKRNQDVCDVMCFIHYLCKNHIKNDKIYLSCTVHEFLRSLESHVKTKFLSKWKCSPKRTLETNKNDQVSRIHKKDMTNNNQRTTQKKRRKKNFISQTFNISTIHESLVIELWTKKKSKRPIKE